MGLATKQPYSPAFYRAIREGCQRSAEALVPAVLDFIPHPRRVVDVGCGEGFFGKAFDERGAQVVGIEGEWAAPIITHASCDLADELPDFDSDAFDLAVCLEVAEHLPPERAAGFVSELCGLAPWVLFSAAIPGQGGHGHLNEQWPSYWVKLFAENGYFATGALRWRIWRDERIKWWYRQNLFLFFPPGAYPTDGCESVIHPELWAHQLASP